MKRYKKLDIKPKALLIGLSGLDFSTRIASKYAIFRKSANLPALIFLRLFGIRGVNKVTNINRMELINNYFRLNLAPSLKVISQLESILNHSKKSNIQAVINTGGHRESYFKNTLLFLKNALHYPHTKKSLERALHYGSPRLIINLNKIINSFIAHESLVSRKAIFLQLAKIGILNKESLLQNCLSSPNASIGDMVFQAIRNRFPLRSSAGMTELGLLQEPQKENLWEQYPVVEYKSPTILPQVNLLLNNRTLFGIKKSLYNETFRRTFVGQASRLSQNASQSDNPTTSRRTSFKMGVDNLYFRTQRRIEQEVEEIKKIVVETKEATEKKSLSTHSLKEDIDKQMKQHLDINRISDQVYQNIERRIRIERERRGL